MVDGDYTQIVPVQKRSISDTIQSIIDAGAVEKARLMRHMALNIVDDDKIYDMFIRSVDGCSLYEMLSILYDKTCYAMDIDMGYKREHPEIKKLLEGIPVFLEDVYMARRRVGRDTVVEAIHLWDEYVVHIQRRGLVPTR